MSTAKKTAKKRASRPEPFAHAKDLADAYREFQAALEEVIERGGYSGIDPRVVGVTGLSACQLWQHADEAVEAWKRLGAAARRVHVAVHGRTNAVRWHGFVRRKAA